MRLNAGYFLYINSRILKFKKKAAPRNFLGAAFFHHAKTHGGVKTHGGASLQGIII